MIRTAMFLSALVAALGWSVPAQADEFIHEANIMARLGNHPNVIHFIGAVTLDVTFTSDAIGNNPLYEDKNMQGQNPLYDASALAGTDESVESISFVLDNSTLKTYLHSEGIIHRDIAARNFLIQTNVGLYQSNVGEFILFGNDGPADLRSSGVGPIRWMAPESIRLYPVSNPDATDPNDYIDIQAFSYFDVNYAPEPASMCLIMVMGAGVMMRRR